MVDYLDQHDVILEKWAQFPDVAVDKLGRVYQGGDPRENKRYSLNLPFLEWVKPSSLDQEIFIIYQWDKRYAKSAIESNLRTLQEEKDDDSFSFYKIKSISFDKKQQELYAI